jgi:hypothetical protein
VNNPTHTARVAGLGEGIAQAVCDCGWQSPRFGADKRLGTMDARQTAEDAADLHQRDCSLGGHR